MEVQHSALGQWPSDVECILIPGLYGNRKCGAVLGVDLIDRECGELLVCSLGKRITKVSSHFFPEKKLLFEDFFLKNFLSLLL